MAIGTPTAAAPKSIKGERKPITKPQTDPRPRLAGSQRRPRTASHALAKSNLRKRDTVRGRRWLPAKRASLEFHLKALRQIRRQRFRERPAGVHQHVVASVPLAARLQLRQIVTDGPQIRRPN